MQLVSKLVFTMSSNFIKSYFFQFKYCIKWILQAYVMDHNKTKDSVSVYTCSYFMKYIPQSVPRPVIYHVIPDTAFCRTCLFEMDRHCSPRKFNWLWHFHINARLYSLNQRVQFIKKNIWSCCALSCCGYVSNILWNLWYINYYSGSFHCHCFLSAGETTLKGYGHNRPVYCYNKYTILNAGCQVLTHWGRDKRAAVPRRHFEMDFLEWKCLNIDWNFTEVCS